MPSRPSLLQRKSQRLDNSEPHLAHSSSAAAYHPIKNSSSVETDQPWHRQSLMEPTLDQFIDAYQYSDSMVVSGKDEDAHFSVTMQSQFMAEEEQLASQMALVDLKQQTSFTKTTEHRRLSADVSSFSPETHQGSDRRASAASEGSSFRRRHRHTNSAGNVLSNMGQRTKEFLRRSKTTKVTQRKEEETSPMEALDIVHEGGDRRSSVGSSVASLARKQFARGSVDELEPDELDSFLFEVQKLNAVRTTQTDPAPAMQARPVSIFFVEDSSDEAVASGTNQTDQHTAMPRRASIAAEMQQRASSLFDQFPYLENLMQEESWFDQRLYSLIESLVKQPLTSTLEGSKVVEIIKVIILSFSSISLILGAATAARTNRYPLRRI